MKKFGIYSLALLMLGVSTMSSGCFGQFALTKKVYNWNDGLGNKWLKSIVMWGLFIIPVYLFCTFVDVVILNLVEFWTGSNPISMKPGEKEQQIVRGKDGNMYEITATQNRFDVVQLTGEKKGLTQSMIFNPEEKTCSVIANGVETKLVKYDEKTNIVELFRPDGSSIAVDANTDPAVAMEMFKSDATFALAK